MTAHQVRQETFDRVWNHFIRDGAPRSVAELAGDVTNMCMYRGPGGSRCAVGLFIPDDEYSPLFEGQPVSYVAERCPSIQKLRKDCGADGRSGLLFLAELQACHDDPQSVDRQHFEARLRQCARGYELTVPVEREAAA